MRAVSLHPDVILVTSQIWQTNCTIVRAGEGGERAEGGGGEECFVIDSPVLPEELGVLPQVLARAGLQLSGLLATHGDWDHLLGRIAFPDVSLGLPESTLRRLDAAPQEPGRELGAFAEEHYMEFGEERELGGVSRPAFPGPAQALPVPGRLRIGSQEIELHPAEGHTCDGMALWAPWAKVLIAGDYLSAVEIPFFGEGGGAPEPYRDTLLRLRPLVEQADYVIPGHGPVLDGAQALAVLEEDLAYLQALGEQGSQAPLPEGRRSEAQRRMHAQNCAALAR